VVASTAKQLQIAEHGLPTVFDWNNVIYLYSF
jgi:hypothetical protein